MDLFAWYKSFLLGVVVPNKELFGYLVTYGEILVGLCLILGLLTRFSSAVGAFMMANYILGPGMARGRSSLAQSETFFVVMIVLFLTNAGVTLGLDGLLFRRKEKT
jgi:thiosulfate dehydrogenase [quinone] large subunit